jgi:hypothetical protein
MAIQTIRHGLTTLGVWTSQPWAFLTVPIYGALWFIFDRESFNWHGVALMYCRPVACRHGLRAELIHRCPPE